MPSPGLSACVCSFLRSTEVILEEAAGCPLASDQRPQDLDTPTLAGGSGGGGSPQCRAEPIHVCVCAHKLGCGAQVCSTPVQSRYVHLA